MLQLSGTEPRGQGKLKCMLLDKPSTLEGQSRKDQCPPYTDREAEAWGGHWRPSPSLIRLYLSSD